MKLGEITLILTNIILLVVLVSDKVKRKNLKLITRIGLMVLVFQLGVEVTRWQMIFSYIVTLWAFRRVHVIKEEKVSRKAFLIISLILIVLSIVTSYFAPQFTFVN